MLSVGLLLLLELIVRKASSLYLFSSENSFSSQNKWLKLTNYFLFFSREMFESDINVIGNSGANLHINDVSNFFWYILSIFFCFMQLDSAHLRIRHIVCERRKKMKCFLFLMVFIFVIFLCTKSTNSHIYFFFSLFPI